MRISERVLRCGDMLLIAHQFLKGGEHWYALSQALIQPSLVCLLSEGRAENPFGENFPDKRPVSIVVNNRNNLSHSGSLHSGAGLQGWPIKCFVQILRYCGCFIKCEIAMSNGGHAIERMNIQIACRSTICERIDFVNDKIDSLLFKNYPDNPGVDAEFKAEQLEHWIGHLGGLKVT